MLFMASKRKYFIAQAHKLYPIPIVPLKHLNDVAGIGETEILNVCLFPSNISRLVFVGTVLGSMRRIFKRMACSRMEAMGQARELKMGGLELRK